MITRSRVTNSFAVCVLTCLLATGCASSGSRPPVPGCSVTLAMPGPQFSVWDDGTVAMAAALDTGNSDRCGGRIELESIEIAGGRLLPGQARTDPKQELGEEENITVRARFQLDADGASR